MPPRPLADETQIDLRLESIRARFPDRYTPDQLAAVRDRIAATVDAARVLRAVPLTNADDPAGPFLPYRAD